MAKDTGRGEKILPFWRNRCNLYMLAAMEVVFDYRIPVLHPLAVHFPLTLLLTAALSALVWMFRGTAFWRRCTAFLALLSVPAALFAYLTGDAMEEQSEGVPIVEELVHLHEDMALYTLWLSIAAAALMAGFLIYARRASAPSRDPILSRIIVGLLICLAAAFVAWTAHIGATMTWGVAAP